MEDALRCLFGLAIFALIAHALYVNGFGWIIYGIGGMFVGLAIMNFVEYYQLPQKAKRLGRISQEISENWKNWRNWK